VANSPSTAELQCLPRLHRPYPLRASCQQRGRNSPFISRGNKRSRALVDLWKQIDSEPLKQLPTLASIKKYGPEELATLAMRMNTSRAWQLVGASLLLSSNIPMRQLSQNDLWRSAAFLAFIGSENHKSINELCEYVELSEITAIDDAFNFAVAKWASDGEVSSELFSTVVEMDRERHRDESPNYEQCLALANFLSGRLDDAKTRLNAARETIGDVPIDTFSCWRYLDVSQNGFIEDLDEMERFFSGEAIPPHFMRKCR
jgi:hypothetical protein